MFIGKILFKNFLKMANVIDGKLLSKYVLITITMCIFIFDTRIFFKESSRNLQAKYC